MTNAVETSGLGRKAGDVVAVADLDLRVATGTFLGILGTNGADYRFSPPSWSRV